MFPTKGAWDRLVPSGSVEETLKSRNPLNRLGEHSELSNLAAFLVSDGASYINGEVVTIDGGEWLMGAGQFNALSGMPDQFWEALREGRRKPQDKDNS
jgi:hypothetical protein